LRLALRVQKNSYLQYSIRMAREVVGPARRVSVHYPVLRTVMLKGTLPMNEVRGSIIARRLYRRMGTRSIVTRSQWTCFPLES